MELLFLNLKLIYCLETCPCITINLSLYGYKFAWLNKNEQKIVEKQNLFHVFANKTDLLQC